MVLTQKTIINGYIGGALRISTPGIYHNANLGLISLSSDGSTRITIADKNLGATTVYNSGDTLSGANCGQYYQRGNDLGTPWTGTVSTSTTKVDTTSYGPGKYYYNNPFIMVSGDWSSVDNANLRGGVTGTDEAMQGPCDVGFHIPTNTERQTVYDIGVTLSLWSSTDGASLSTYLKMPLSGYRNGPTAGTNYQNTGGSYWSSVAESTGKSYYFRFVADSVGILSGGRSQGYSIRPFKNGVVQPDTNWTKLN